MGAVKQHVLNLKDLIKELEAELEPIVNEWNDIDCMSPEDFDANAARYNVLTKDVERLGGKLLLLKAELNLFPEI